MYIHFYGGAMPATKIKAMILNLKPLRFLKGNNYVPSKNFYWLILSIVSLSFYWLLPVNYNIYYIDDAWVLSNVWNITQYEIAKDLVFIPAGESGHVQYFGISYAKIMGGCLDVLGWTKQSVFMVNSIFIWLTALVWYQILKHLPFSSNVRKLTLVLLPIFPPFFFAAHCCRPEAMILFLLSLQYFLFIRKQYFLALLLLGPAIESHIMGAVGGFYLMAHLWFYRKELMFKWKPFMRLTLQSVLGLTFALGYYFYFHMDHFSVNELSNLVSQKRDMGSPLNNYILNYFMNYDWYSRVWEFALLLISIGLFVKRRLFKRNPYLLVLLCALVISTLITRRENRNYFVYIFPAFMLLYFYVFEQLGILKRFVIGLVSLMGVYYLGHFYFNGDYKFQKGIAAIEKNLSNDKLNIVGIPDFWFASKEKRFVPLHHRQSEKLHTLNDFYFIESDYLAWRCKLYSKTKAYYEATCKGIMIKEIELGGERKIRIWKYHKTALTEYHLTEN